MYGLISAVLADKGHAVWACRPSDTVAEAVRQMNEKGIGALLVQDAAGATLGIFSERDVLRRVLDGRRDPAHTQVADVMTHDLLIVRPGTSVADAMALMTLARVRHLPVVTAAEGTVAGMVSIGDLLRWVSRHQESEIEHLSDYIMGRAPA